MAETSAEPTHWRPGSILLGAALFTLLLVIGPQGGISPKGWHTLSVVTLMAVWWIGQAMPLAITALVPLVVFPSLGVVTLKDAASAYGNPIIFLFLGGFMIAKAMERWRLHRRIAITILSRIGTKPGAIIAGVMGVAALLSMWVSNTATTAMMLPIGLSIVALLHADGPGATTAGPGRNFAVGLMLGIAYGANVGGIATLIGTPTNAVLAAYLLETHKITVAFDRWMMIGVPIALLLLAACWIVLTRISFPVGNKPVEGARELLQREAAALGRMGASEVRVLIIFLLVAILWLARPLIVAALPGMPLSDPSIAIFGALLLFLVPAGREPGEEPGTPLRPLLVWDEAKTIPWGVCLLVGGGLALADAMDHSGLARQIGGALPGCDAWPLLALLVLLAGLVVFLTEVTTNVAMTAILLPVAVGLAGCDDVPIIMLTTPIAIAASCAFMMPIATPPNAIVFGSGYISIRQMVRAGFILNIISTAVVAVACYLLLPLIF